MNPETVRFLWTILNDEVSRGIAQEIADMVVFTVRTLHKYKPVSKTTAHEVVNRLEEQGIVEPTRYKATNPDPTYTGPKSRFYKLCGVELEDRDKDPLIKRAQRAHNSSFRQTPEKVYEQSREAELIDNSTALVNYYKARHEYGSTWTPKIGLIRQRVADKHPEYDSEFLTKVALHAQNKLYKIQEVS